MTRFIRAKNLVKCKMFILKKFPKKVLTKQNKTNMKEKKALRCLKNTYTYIYM